MARRTGNTSDPLPSFTWGLDIEGVEVAYFTECTGIGSENQVIEHKVVDKGGKELTMKIPGRRTWGDLTLKRGVTGEMQIWDWRDMVEKGEMERARRNGSVVMYDRDYVEVARWDFTNAWPSKVSGPSLDAASTDIGIEEITIVHEGLDRVA